MKRAVPSAGRSKLQTPATTGVESEAGIAHSIPAAEFLEGARQVGLRAGESPAPGRGVFADLYGLFKDMLRGSAGWPIIRLCIAVLVILVGNMIGQVRLNQWNGTFFDAVAKRNTTAFLDQLQVFLGIVLVLLTLVVAQTWLQERLKIRLRQRLTQILFDMWLAPKQAYRLGFVGSSGAQPDQRMQEDCRLFSELTSELGVGVLQSLLLLISFIGVLWTLSSYASFEFNGREVVLHGYMVWVAIGYAALGSGLTWLVGKPLIRLNTERYRREAELRFAIVRVNESAESVSFHAGETDERRGLDAFLDAVLKASRRLSGALARLTWITSGYGWFAIIVPILAAAPGYFNERLSFGELMMVVGAFNQVQSALRYFVDHFPKFADWRSAVLRVSLFRQSVSELERIGSRTASIKIERDSGGALVFDGLSIALADGSIIIDEATAEIRPGERVLILGESGSGKSTLFRAIAGLWPWGSGRISTPDPDTMMFLPQRPYLPLGTLRAALTYPAGPDRFSDALVRDALSRCGLGEYYDAIDTLARWDRSLSLGQQQRVAFARVLLHRPGWVFMDEATSALDEDSQTELLNLFSAELAGTSILSIGHRPGLERFHTRSLLIRKTTAGANLVSLQPEERRRGKADAESVDPDWPALASEDLVVPASALEPPRSTVSLLSLFYRGLTRLRAAAAPTWKSGVRSVRTKSDT